MLTKEQQLKWIKEGRGQGFLSKYKPFLTVKDNKSLNNRSSRVYGYKTGRTHHLFSDLELAVFLILDRNIFIKDIREQMPLNLKETEELARTFSLYHPMKNGIAQTLVSTFFIVSEATNAPPVYVIRAISHTELENLNILESLELERRYWQKENIPWYLVTEKDIPLTVVDNIKWLYPANYSESKNHTTDKINFYYQQFIRNSHLSLIELSKYIDVQYSLEPGESLLEIRELIAQRYFVFDINISYRKITCGNIKLSEQDSWEAICNASNQ